MVSLQPTLPPNRRKAIPEYDQNISKKRKLEGIQTPQIFENRSKGESTKISTDDHIELQLESTPLPLEWQRCLDIQSGQIHFYNTRTQKRTSRDPRRSPEPAIPDGDDDDDHIMSLDLRLNLPCESLRKSCQKESSRQEKNLGGFDQAGDNQEMIATVCTRCHMFVMLCKSSPACPNCKFMHPPDQGPPTLFKRRCTLFC